MKAKSNLKTTLISTAALILVASSPQISASDYRFWREQVLSNHAESRTVDHIGGEEGSWFLKEIVTNHLGQTQGQSVRGLNGVRTSSSSVSNNWFIHAIAPHHYNGGIQNSPAHYPQIAVETKL